jgi:tetratricopeptide (TPR) repeat protein
VNVLAADRFLFLPTAMAWIAASLAGPRLVRHLPRAELVVPFSFVALLVASCFFTVRRIAVWNDELGFWLEGAEQSDFRNSIPPNELANVFYRAGYFQDAYSIYERYAAVLKRAGHAGSDAYRRQLANAANCLSEEGKYDEALAIRRSLIASRPDVPAFVFARGLIELHRFEFEAARASFEQALSIEPDFPEARAMLEQVAAAEEAWPPLAAQPEESLGTAMLAEKARWLFRLGRRLDAEKRWRDVLARADATPAHLREGAWLLAHYGTLEGARDAMARLARSNTTLDATPDASAIVGEVVQKRERFAENLGANRPRLNAYVAKLQRASTGDPRAGWPAE